VNFRKEMLAFPRGQPCVKGMTRDKENMWKRKRHTIIFGVFENESTIKNPGGAKMQNL